MFPGNIWFRYKIRRVSEPALVIQDKLARLSDASYSQSLEPKTTRRPQLKVEVKYRQYIKAIIIINTIDYINN